MIWAVRISMLLISLVAIGLSVAGGAAIRRRRWSHGIWFDLGSVGAGVAAWNAVWAVSYLFGMFMLSGPGDPSVESMGLLEPTLRDAVIWSLPAVIVSPFGIVLVVIGAVGWIVARHRRTGG